MLLTVEMVMIMLCIYIASFIWGSQSAFQIMSHESPQHFSEVGRWQGWVQDGWNFPVVTMDSRIASSSEKQSQISSCKVRYICKRNIWPDND